MAVAKKSIHLFYDVISPYSWVAFEVLGRYRSKWAIDLQFKPVFLGGIFKATGTQSIISLDYKFDHMVTDLDRLSRHYTIPLKRAEWFRDFASKGGSLPAQRFLAALELSHPEFVEPMSRELWYRLWSRAQDIKEAEGIAEAAKVAGMSDADTEQIMARLTTSEVKGKLKQTTDELLSLKGFGVPTIVVDNGGKQELVFGSDRFHILADILGEKYEGPLTHLACK